MSKINDFHTWYEIHHDDNGLEVVDIWLAGCEYQKEKDAELVEEFVNEHTFYRAGQIIRNQ